MTAGMWILAGTVVGGLVYWGLVKIAKHMFGQ